jgi:hypothetical protein
MFNNLKINKKVIGGSCVILAFFLLSSIYATAFGLTAPVPANSVQVSDPPKNDHKKPEQADSASLVNKEKVKPDNFNNDESSINLDIQEDEKQIIKVSDPVQKVDGQLFKSEEEKMQHVFQAQKKMDIDDIKLLWEATVERNTIIKFALKKLAMPPEQRRIHSSIMAKSISALISGVAILPNILGVDSFTSTASLAGGSLANRIIQNKTAPKQMPLTDSELIQLAKLVEELQNKVIKNYYEYKSSIESLRVCRQNLLRQNKNYSEALQSGNSIAIVASASLYDKELLNELRLKQQIKLNRLELERLVGDEIVSKLDLTKIVNGDADTTTVKENIKEAVSMEAKK